MLISSFVDIFRHERGARRHHGATMARWGVLGDPVQEWYGRES